MVGVCKTKLTKCYIEPVTLKNFNGFKFAKNTRVCRFLLFGDEILCYKFSTLTYIISYTLTFLRPKLILVFYTILLRHLMSPYNLSLIKNHFFPLSEYLVYLTS